MVELGRYIQTVLLDMERGVLSSHPGWDSSVVSGTPPRHFGSQRKEKDPEVRMNMGIKLMMVFVGRYFEYGLILSLTFFFSVPKGDTDIQMVYNGTSSGINAHLWAPWFALPTIYDLALALEVGTFIGDSDIG
jgi:hypothetical protein